MGTPLGRVSHRPLKVLRRTGVVYGTASESQAAIPLLSRIDRTAI